MGVVSKMGLSWKLPDTLQYERLQKILSGQFPSHASSPAQVPSTAGAAGPVQMGEVAGT